MTLFIQLNHTDVLKPDDIDTLNLIKDLKD